MSMRYIVVVIIANKESDTIVYTMVSPMVCPRMFMLNSYLMKESEKIKNSAKQIAPQIARPKMKMKY